MDTLPPASVGEEDIRRIVSEEWRLTPGAIRYMPKGAGSYHWVAECRDQRFFVTVDDLDTKPWIGAQRDATFHGLDRAYEAAWTLHHRAGLGFVVGPTRSPGGSVTVRLSDRYSVAVFPFIEGTPGAWGDPLDPPVRAALTRELALLHETAPVGLELTERPLAIPERPALESALDALDRAWAGGPLSETARHALAAHSADVRRWLQDFDTLAARLRGERPNPIVTHGEPHPGNLIHTDSGLRLIDWDTVALARPERDLWMLDDGSPDSLDLYEKLTGTRISTTALRFYGLAWTLSDIASFTDMFRSPHKETQWLRQKWNGFQRLLQGEPSAPFARR